MKRKIIAFVVAIVLSLGAFGLLVGCGDNKKVIRVAAHEGAYGKAFWADLEEEFEKDYPEYDVIVETNVEINKSISPRIESMDGTEPDVIYYGTNQSSGYATQLLGATKDKSLLISLNDILEENVPGEDVKLKNKIQSDFMIPSITDPNAFGETYMLPLFYSVNGLYYNKNIVTGETAKTWKEVKNTVVASGQYQYAYPRGGYLDNQILANMYSIFGQDSAKWDKFMKMNDASIYEDTKVVQLFTDLAALNTVFPTGNDWMLQAEGATDVTTNTKNFYDGKYAYFPGGSFMGGEAKAAGTDTAQLAGKIGFMAYPGVDAADDRYVTAMGEQVYALKTGDADREKMAKTFIAYLYSDKAVKIIAKGNAMVPVKGCATLAAEAGMDADTLSIFGVIDQPGVNVYFGSLPNKNNTTVGSNFHFKQAVCFGMDVAMGVRTPYEANKPVAPASAKGNAQLWINGIKLLCNQA